jgi:hypothetical protein
MDGSAVDGRRGRRGVGGCAGGGRALGAGRGALRGGQAGRGQETGENGGVSIVMEDRFHWIAKIPNLSEGRNGVYTPLPSARGRVDFLKRECRENPMEPIIEKDSAFVPLLLLTLMFLILVGSGLGLAYLAGVFTGKSAVSENDKRITNQAAVIVPAASKSGK